MYGPAAGHPVLPLVACENLGYPGSKHIFYDERGLLGMALHPDFPDTRKFYVRYSAQRHESTPPTFDHTDVLVEYKATSELTQVDPDSKRIILSVPQPDPTHNGGAVCFGQDGYLYSSYGDGGYLSRPASADYQDWYSENFGNSAQIVERDLLGGIHRLNVDQPGNDTPYTIPPDNPLVGECGHNEYYAWGFRNPWRMSVDSHGRLFAADVGEQLYEEVNLVEKGTNYGWNIKEGTHCFNADNYTNPLPDCPEQTPPVVRGGEPLRDPIIEYPRTRENIVIGTAVIGGYVYEATSISDLNGDYVFGDFLGRVFAASPSPSSDQNTWAIKELPIMNHHSPNGHQYILSFGRDAAGELYLLTTQDPQRPDGNTGVVYRISPAS